MWGIIRIEQEVQPAVHPHARGEYSFPRSRIGQRSVHPHVRGEYIRLIGPARNGTPVHPHVRGEYCAILDFFERPVHPHARGNTATISKTANSLRFTPTHVGNTSPRRQLRGVTVHPHARGEYRCACYGERNWSVHPHARGEYVDDQTKNCNIGSPPRAWGILHPGGDCRGAATVHPHARGEYRCASCGETEMVGSPPRTWGILRFIPRSFDLDGSPPRTWGILQFLHHSFDFGRFTPTHVGNT